MKKFLLSLSFLILGCLSINAQSTQIEIKFVKPESGTKPHSPIISDYIWSLSAEYNSEELTMSIEGYTGEITVLILKKPHHIMYNSNKYINYSEVLDIDITSYTSGNYTIFIELENGDLYQGEIEII